MAEIASTVPLSFRAGDRVQWKQSFSDFPASSFDLSYFLVNESNQIKIDASADGDDFLISVPATTTAGFNAGIYSFIARVDDGAGDIETVDVGKIEILPDFEAATTGFDDRSHVKKVLDALEATILGKASLDQLSYSIAGRSISRLSPSELIEWRDQYRKEYLRLERLAGRGRPSTIQVRF